MSIDYVRRLFGLDGQTAVVIGGSGVIGGAICEGLGRAGSALVIAGRSASRGHKRVEVVRALSGTAGFRHVDVLERKSIEQLLEYALGEHGQVDILVNCVSSPRVAEMGETDEQLWDRMLSVQARGPHWATQIFAAQMARQTVGGSILNVVSSPVQEASATRETATAARSRSVEPSGQEALDRIPRQSGRLSARRQTALERENLAQASRAALLDVSRRAAQQWAAHGVRINVLELRLFTESAQGDLGASGEGRRANREVVAGRDAVLEDMVGATLLLVSRQAGAMITGQCLRVDGGRSS